MHRMSGGVVGFTGYDPVGGRTGYPFTRPPVTLRLNRNSLMIQGTDILVVDDRSDIRYTIATVLRRNGYGVIMAADGASALKRAGTQGVGLFLLDVDLPDMNGFELCRRLKSNQDLAQIPVIMCSANCAEEDLHEAASAGALAYISKPFDMVKLIDCIHRVWAQHSTPVFDGIPAGGYGANYSWPVETTEPV
jgi:CheY-like chemotaxis protein